MNPVSSPTDLKHDAFISYSRRNEAFAAILEGALERYTPPKELNRARRHLDVFRDKADFTAGEYHQRLENHLRSSAKLIVVCSPDARKSQFVNEEIQRFATLMGADNIIPVLLQGVPNNEAKETEENEMAFPEALCEEMSMPLAVNYLHFDPKREKVNKGAFVEAWYMLLANIYDVSRSEIEQREKKRRQRTRRTVYSALTGSIAVLSVLLIFALVSRSEAITSRKDAEDQRNQAIAAAAEAQKQKAAAESARVNEETQRKRAEDQTIVAQEQTKIAQQQRDIAQHQTQIAEERRREAERQQQIAFAGSISARSEVVRNQGTIPSEIREYQFGSTSNAWPNLLERALLLSVEGAKRIRKADGRYSLESTQAVLSAVSQFPRTETRLDKEDDVEELSFSADGRHLMAFGKEKVSVWSEENWRLVSQFELEIENAALSENGRYLAIKSRKDELIVLDLNANRELWRKPDQDGLDLHTFSRDGRYLVTSVESRANVWETSTGKLVSHVDHPDRVRSATFNLDGSELATACYEHPVRISNTLTGAELRHLKGGEDALAIAFSADGRFIATGQHNNADIWEAQSGETVKHIPGIPVFDDESEYIIHLTFSNDGSGLATVGDDGTTQLWDVATGNLKWVVGCGYNARLSVDRKYIFIRQPPGVEVWDITTGKEVARLIDKRAEEGFAFDPHRNRFAVAAEKSVVVLDGSSNQEIERNSFEGRMHPSLAGPYVALVDHKVVTLWDNNRAREIAHFAHDADVDDVTIDDDGKHAATTAKDGSVRIWEVASSKETASVGGVPSVIVRPAVDSDDEDRKEVNVKYFFFSPHGKYLVVIGRDRVTHVWEVPSGREITRIVSDAEVDNLQFAPNESHFGLVIHGKPMRLFETASGNYFDVPGETSGEIAFSADGKYFAKATGRVVKIYEVETRKGIATFTATSNAAIASNIVATIAFSDDGKLLALGSTNQTAQVWRLADGKQVAVIPHGYRVNYLHFTHNGQFLISGVLKAGNLPLGTCTLSVWDVNSRKEIARLLHKNAIEDVELSPDERYLVTASEDHTALVYDLSSLREIGQLLHDDTIFSVNFSRDGKYIVTASRDSTARVWESSTARELVRLNHDGEVFKASFVANGDFVLTASMDKTQRLWQWRSEDLMKRACQVLTRNLTLSEWTLFFGTELYHPTCENLPAGN